MVVICILLTCWMIEKFLNGIVLLYFRNIGLYGGHMYAVVFSFFFFFFSK
jgi:hypothetical protein